MGLYRTESQGSQYEMKEDPWRYSDGWREWLYESEASQRGGDDGSRRWNARAIVPEGCSGRREHRESQSIAYTSHLPLAVPENVLSK